MATTRYIVSATKTFDEKKISNLKSARKEADLRAKGDREDVTVTTAATGKLVYTARGALPTPAAPAEPQTAEVADQEPEEAPAEEASTEQNDAEEAPAEGDDAEEAPAEGDDAEEAPAEGDAEVDAETMVKFNEALAEIIGEPAGDEDAAIEDPANEGEPAEASDTTAAPERPQPEHRGQAECGCSVEKIIASGEHGKGCKNIAAAKEKTEAVKRDKPARKGRTGGGGRRESQGPSAAAGWDLLYDKPKQNAQVGRKDGEYALICTTHKRAHKLVRLVQERGLRQGKRSVWCPECTD